MLFSTTSKILFDLLLDYKYLFLFPIVVAEGPLVTMASGFLVSVGLMTPVIALPIIILGDMSGDVIYYYIGKFGEKWMFTRWLIKKFGFESVKEKIKHSFEVRGGKILLFGKLTHALGAVFLMGAGYSQMNLSRFIWYNLIGTCIKSSVLLYIGYLAGSAYEHYLKYFESGTLILSLGSIAITLIFLFLPHYIFDRKGDVEKIKE